MTFPPLPPPPNSGSQIQHLRICPALPKFWICDHEFSGGGSFTTFHFYRWIQVTDTAFDDLFRASQILKLWSRIQGGGSLYCNENGQTVRQVKERRRHPNGKLQLEWASNRPPLSEIGITDSEFEDLSRTSQILNLCSRIQWRGFIYCNENGQTVKAG